MQTTNCTAKIRFQFKNGLYEITGYDLTHNHETDEDETKVMVVANQFTEAEFAVVERMLLGKQSVLEMIEVIQSKIVL